MPRYIVGVGSNIQPEQNIVRALQVMRNQIDPDTLQAPLLFTKAEGDTSQPDYINTAFQFTCALSASELKQQLLQIEAMLLRVRSSNKNAARTIDLDICCIDDEIIDNDYYKYSFVKDSVDYFIGARPNEPTGSP